MDNFINMVLIVALWTVLYRMIVARRMWLSILGCILSIILVASLSFQLGYKIASKPTICDPAPIEVYL